MNCVSIQRGARLLGFLGLVIHGNSNGNHKEVILFSAEYQSLLCFWHMLPIQGSPSYNLQSMSALHYDVTSLRV